MNHFYSYRSIVLRKQIRGSPRALSVWITLVGVAAITSKVASIVLIVNRAHHPVGFQWIRLLPPRNNYHISLPILAVREIYSTERVVKKQRIDR